MALLNHPVIKDATTRTAMKDDNDAANADLRYTIRHPTRLATVEM